MSSSRFKIKRRNSGSVSLPNAGAISFSVSPFPLSGAAGSVALTGNLPGATLAMVANVGTTYSLSNIGDAWTLSWTSSITGPTSAPIISHAKAGYTTQNSTMMMTVTDAIGLTDVAFQITPAATAGFAGSVVLTGTAARYNVSITTNPGGAYSLFRLGDQWTLSWPSTLTAGTASISITQAPALGGSSKTTVLSLPIAAYNQTPVLRATSVKMGAWTLANRGHVPLKNILLAPGSPPAKAWTLATASSGTDTHFTRPAAGVLESSGNAYTPRPSTAGDTADLSSGTYVWAASCTGLDDSASNSVNLTYTIEPDAASMGHYDAFDTASIVGTVATFEAKNANPKSLLISTGVNHLGVRNGGTSFNFNSMVRIRHADPTRPSQFTTWECDNNSYVRWEEIRLSGDASVLATNGLWHLGDGTTRTNCEIIDCGVNMGSDAKASPTAGSIQLFGTNTDIVITRFVGLWNENGIKDKPTDVNTRITWNQCTFRYSFDNNVFISNAIDWVMNDLVLASPTRKAPPAQGKHVDHFQIQDALGTERVNGLTINRLIIIDADGDAYAGGMFGLRGKYTINGYIYLGRSNHALTINGLEAGASVIKNVSMFKGYGQTFNTTAPIQIDDTVYPNNDPSIRTYGSTTNNQNAWTAGTLMISSAIIQEGEYYSSVYISGTTYPGVKPSTMTTAASVHYLGIQSPTPTPNSAITAYLPVDPRIAYDAVTTAQWAAMDREALVAFAMARVTPKAGVTDGALKSDGTWNT